MECFEVEYVKMYFRVRPHVREPGRRRGQRHLPRARAGKPQQPKPPVPVHFPGGCWPARARRVPYFRSARQTTRVRIPEDNNLILLFIDDLGGLAVSVVGTR